MITYEIQKWYVVMLQQRWRHIDDILQDIISRINKDFHCEYETMEIHVIFAPELHYHHIAVYIP